MQYKTALITGASTGIGKAIAFHLAAMQVNLVLMARRENLLREIQTELSETTRVDIVIADITNHNQTAAQLNKLGEVFQQVDVLINNAGLALGQESADQCQWQDWQSMIDTNCAGLAFVTHQIVPIMVANNCGHIVNIGSTAGAYPYYGSNIYGASKAFVKQFSKNLRTDVLGKNIRVTNIAPGMVGESEFSTIRFHGDRERADAVYRDVQPLTPDDIANCVCWVLEQPSHVNINEIELMPVAQAAAGLAVHRRPIV